MAALDTKTRILQAAHTLLSNGGQNISMADIARQTGISRQAVYIHYPSREALLLALNAYLLHEFGIEKEQRAIGEAGTGIDALLASAALQARVYPLVWGVARAIETARKTDAAAESVWQVQVRASLGSCSSTVAMLKRDNLLRAELDPETATDLLWALTSIAIWEELVLQRGWSRERYQKHVSNLLIAALTTAAPI